MAKNNLSSIVDFAAVRVGLLISLSAAVNPMMAQPTRDPNTPGFVAAKELPDGSVPPSKAASLHVILSRADNANPVRSPRRHGPDLCRARTEESHGRSNTHDQLRGSSSCARDDFESRAISYKRLPPHPKHRRAAPARTPASVRGTSWPDNLPDKTRDNGKIESLTA